MARINFDDDVESKEAFWKLLSLVGGNRDDALGKLVRFFRIAQKRFGEGIAISETDLKEVGLECMIQSGWAVPWNDGYQAPNCEKHFDWYRVMKDGARIGGLRSAEVRRKKYGTSQPISSNPPSGNNEPPFEPPFEKTTEAPNPLTPALAPALIKKEDLIEVHDPPPQQETLPIVDRAEAAADAPGLPAKIEPQWVRARNQDWGEFLKIYQDPGWMEGEVRKMALWLNANRGKMPRSKSGWHRFTAGWLERGWEKYRRALPSKPSEMQPRVAKNKFRPSWEGDDPPPPNGGR